MWWAGYRALGLQLPRVGEVCIIHDVSQSWVHVESPGESKNPEDIGSTFSFNWSGSSLGIRTLKATPSDCDVPPELTTAVWKPEVQKLALAKPGPGPAASGGEGTGEKCALWPRHSPTPTQ